MIEVKTIVEIDWKTRAINRRAENKALKKRIKELVISRDLWHKKAMDSKKENVELVTKLNSVKKKINQINEM